MIPLFQFEVMNCKTSCNSWSKWSVLGNISRWPTLPTKFFWGQVWNDCFPRENSSSLYGEIWDVVQHPTARRGIGQVPCLNFGICFEETAELALMFFGEMFGGYPAANKPSTFRPRQLTTALIHNHQKEDIYIYNVISYCKYLYININACTNQKTKAGCDRTNSWREYRFLSRHMTQVAGAHFHWFLVWVACEAEI